MAHCALQLDLVLHVALGVWCDASRNTPIRHPYSSYLWNNITIAGQTDMPQQYKNLRHPRTGDHFYHRTPARLTDTLSPVYSTDIMYKAFFLALLVGTVLAGDNGRLRRPLKGSSKKAGALRETTWQSFHSSVVVAFQSSGASYLRDEMRAAYNDLKAKADAAKAAVPGCEQIVTSKLQTSCVSCVVHQLQSAFNDPATSSVLNVEGIGSEVEAFADGTLASVSNAMNLAAGTVWSGVQSAANVIVDAGEEFLNADGDVVDAAGNLVSNVGDTVGGAIDSIGDAIGGIFGGGLGRRKRAVRAESQREQACFLFADPSACHTSCDKSYLKSTYCPTLIAAEAALHTSQQQNGWITNLPQQHDLIFKEITVNSNGVNSAGYFHGAVVEATIFGYDMMFAVSSRSPISPQDYVQGGRVLAEQALNIFKLYHPFTGN